MRLAGRVVKRADRQVQAYAGQGTPRAGRGRHRGLSVRGELPQQLKRLIGEALAAAGRDVAPTAVDLVPAFRDAASVGTYWSELSS